MPHKEREVTVPEASGGRDRYPMGKIVYFAASSLDGFIAGKGGELDWLFTDADYGYTPFYRSVSVLIMGRRTYEKIQTIGPYPYAGKPAYVLTRKPFENTGDVTFIDRSCAEFVKELSDATEGIIWLVGGGALAGSLLTCGLIDQIIVSIHPVFLGSGIPLIQGPDQPVQFNITGYKSYPSGLIQVIYSK